MNKKTIKRHSSRIITKLTLEGISIEEQLRKAMEGKEPIEANARISYTERKDGVLPQYDIRTDRFEMALQATDRIAMSEAASRHFQDFPDMYEKNEDGSFKMDEAGKPILIKN